MVLVVVDEGNEFSHQRIGIGVDGVVLMIGRQQFGLHQDAVGVDVSVDVDHIGVDVDNRRVVGQLVVSGVGRLRRVRVGNRLTAVTSRSQVASSTRGPAGSLRRQAR